MTHVTTLRPGLLGSDQSCWVILKSMGGSVLESAEDQAEIEIGMFARQCLGKRRISDLKALRREARAWNRQMSRNQVKINWQFDRKAARRKFGYTTNSFKRSGN